MKFYDFLRNIYIKNPKIEESEINMNIVIGFNKFLALDRNNLPILTKLSQYTFYLDPIHYYYLLFFNIPQKSQAPFLKKIDKFEEVEDNLLDKIQYVLGWSKAELKRNLPILSKTILKNREYWNKLLGI